MEGYTSSFQPLYGAKDRKQTLKNGVEVIRADIPTYFHDMFSVDCVNFFTKYKDFGFPYSGGWAEQLNQHMEIITTLTSQDKLYGNVKPKL
ncbi:MAG: hypothetical protein ACOWWR_07810 [Eubacteriales bacterium]